MGQENNESKWEAKWRKERLLDLLTPRTGETYNMLKGRLAELVMRQEIASLFKARFNERLRESAHATFEEKKSLSKWANGELRDLGLAIRCQKTGEQAIILGVTRRDPAAGGFRLEAVFADGSRRITTCFNNLVDLDLMPARPRISPFQSHASRAPKGKGSSSEPSL